MLERTLYWVLGARCKKVTFLWVGAPRPGPLNLISQKKAETGVYIEPIAAHRTSWRFRDATRIGSGGIYEWLSHLRPGRDPRVALSAPGRKLEIACFAHLK